MENKNRSFLIFDSFILKIVAMVTMTFDHVGWLLASQIGENYWLVIVFRIIGRIALPLYCLMIVEGVLHTKNIGKYFLRLGIMATAITAVLAFVGFVPPFSNEIDIRNEGNIFIDLLLGVLAVYALTRKEWYFKVLAFIPLGIGIAAYFANTLELVDGMLIHWFPFFLRPQYFFYGVGLIILFYFAYLLKDIFLKQYSANSGIPVESLEGTNIERIAVNLFSILMLIIATLGLYLMSFFTTVYWIASIQNAAIISGAFILFYNGKRGYNAKWFQYGCYLYYPLHLVLIFGIGMLIMMIGG